MEEIERLEKKIKEAKASILIDNLPLSEEYVLKYKNDRINKIKNTKTLILKRGNINGTGRKK